MQQLVLSCSGPHRVLSRILFLVGNEVMVGVGPAGMHMAHNLLKGSGACIPINFESDFAGS